MENHCLICPGCKDEWNRRTSERFPFVKIEGNSLPVVSRVKVGRQPLCPTGEQVWNAYIDGASV